VSCLFIQVFLEVISIPYLPQRRGFLRYETAYLEVDLDGYN